jgi:hypothetical protein
MLTRTNCVEHGIGPVDTCEYDGSIGHSTVLVGTCEDDGSIGQYRTGWYFYGRSSGTVQDWSAHFSNAAVVGTLAHVSVAAVVGTAKDCLAHLTVAAVVGQCRMR